ncbi:desulfoferrodoxin [Clostridium argentinense CDC 2741]|uniref:Desulfoferrodoxin n=1 Tax=Clostridium argentinense CDC 2741 TaxID=1418104 RepID=A0A0C1UF98_9CLOT|nr:desulfoferrodoxin [Clostridium argentinense]ARC85823.1 desulfoferrodoxin [Clostridium argentinense]KIE46040.1 desulfoferrodoxin [Clostridium argentinense CDC 2741]NFF39906.1 desulfoferrodoxin [Clostridium argentinense]NFP48537.1 desulfoferrodoxin [Clostridium argentinense]NFP71195.1 desulfoferrodoxin [Clostridium argentinense]
MTELRQVYKCDICGNMIEVVHAAGGSLVCCGKPMTLKKENTTDAANEKHVPVLEEVDGKVVVRIGSVEHPMTPEHHIEWIELHTEDRVYRKYLTVDEKPEAVFNITLDKVLYAREYCNLHGLWKS